MAVVIQIDSRLGGSRRRVARKSQPLKADMWFELTPVPEPTPLHRNAYYLDLADRFLSGPPPERKSARKGRTSS
jgi:hypothetical protein